MSTEFRMHLTVSTPLQNALDIYILLCAKLTVMVIDEVGEKMSTVHNRMF
jgi:hypothetical protein